jgi:hypothetical protein
MRAGALGLAQKKRADFEPLGLESAEIPLDIPSMMPL